MTDSETITTWMNGYIRAWDSNSADDIRALFTDDAVYLTAPFVPERVGIDAIVDGWLADQDQPGDHEFTWHEVALDGDLAFVEGLTIYNNPERRYANLWIIRFAPDGRASAYTEWYMRLPEES